ncbi:hypothetical protein [Bradyrhizobium sp. 141]|uniref:hypothetical protein n=1 Tax=Bradyrhizobium sp. 141 TaxID=2782617 RepID=UPI001FFBECBF|nr:hypothetical protein [Bradyrhizobium sp. 141]
MAPGHDLLQPSGDLSRARGPVAIYGLFSDPTAIARHLDQVSGFLPGGAVDVARDQLTRVASKDGGTLGATFVIGLGIAHVAPGLAHFSAATHISSRWAAEKSAAISLSGGPFHGREARRLRFGQGCRCAGFRLDQAASLQATGAASAACSRRTSGRRVPS